MWSNQNRAERNWIRRNCTCLVVVILWKTSGTRWLSTSITSPAFAGGKWFWWRRMLISKLRYSLDYRQFPSINLLFKNQGCSIAPLSAFRPQDKSPRNVRRTKEESCNYRNKGKLFYYCYYDLLVIIVKYLIQIRLKETIVYFLQCF